MTLPPDVRAVGQGPPLVRRWTVVGDEVVHSRETSGASNWSGYPVVLVHGLWTTSRYFRPLLRAFDGHVPAAAVELPGIGRTTDHHVPDDIAGQAAVVAAWLRATRRHPAVLAGNSMGAQTVVEVAVRHPELVAALVLIGPTVDAAARGPLRQLGRLLVDAPRERPSLLAVTASDTFLTKSSAVLRYARASLTHRIEERITEVVAPTLLVRGSADPVAPQRWLEELAAETTDASIVTVPGAAHACHHGRPHAVAALLGDVRQRLIDRTPERGRRTSSDRAPRASADA